MIYSGSMSDQPSWNKMHSARPVLPQRLQGKWLKWQTAGSSGTRPRRHRVRLLRHSPLIIPGSSAICCPDYSFRDLPGRRPR